MLEEIIGSVCRYSNEKIKITKGMAVAAALGAFIIGLISGVVAARLALSKKFAAFLHHRAQCGHSFRSRQPS